MRERCPAAAAVAARPVLALCLLAVCVSIAIPSTASPIADYLGRPIASVRLTQEGADETDPELLRILEIRAGEPLSMEQVRESLLHLFSLGRFEDVQAHATLNGERVDLVFDLIPLHAVGRVEFQGRLGMSEGRVRAALADRVGATPPIGRAAAAAEALKLFYADQGFLSASVAPRSLVDHRTERTTLIFDIDAGPQVVVGDVTIDGTPTVARARLLDTLGLEPGDTYEPGALQRRIAGHLEALRSKGYYEAFIDYSPTLRSDRPAVDIALRVAPGPLVTVAFEGNPLSKDLIERLAPIEFEGSVDEDLLEDSSRRIENHLRSEGYRNAAVTFRREPGDSTLRVVFDVRRGRLHTVARIEISGASRVAESALQPLLRLAPDGPFVEATLASDAAVLTEHYRRRGFAAARVEPVVETLERAGPATPVRVHFQIAEGQQVSVGSIAFQGNDAVPEAALRQAIRLSSGAAFYRPDVVTAADALVVYYRDRGYQEATVTFDTPAGQDTGLANVVFSISEGPQVIVDHVLIVGNHRTSESTILREVLLESGKPLGMSDFVETQRRLRALGLFRRVSITEITHSDRHRRDLLITVEEAPPTTVAFGGGIEGGERLRIGADGRAVERLEFAARGFLEVGRRNLWGKNRSISLLTRISVRPRDSADGDREDGQGIGFSEYRLLGVYREPRPFGTPADLSVSAVLEQAIRSSFNFSRRGTAAAIDRRVNPQVTLSGRYNLTRTKLFDERFAPDEALLIDRLFPQVRLSTLSAILTRDTRDDSLDPAGGTFLGVDGEITARSIGSQVGFAKTFLQGFAYRRLTSRRRVILALGARLGLADGFPREVARLDANGQPVLDDEGRPVMDFIEDLPASERFFGGGDTTVRGFELDRLGDEATIDQRGFPRGGNSSVVFNAELRFPLWGAFGGVAFLDAGNVFAKVSDLDLTSLRGGTGLGLRWQSPVGPLRVDWGFKLDRRRIGPDLERPHVVHISLGHAF